MAGQGSFPVLTSRLANKILRQQLIEEDGLTPASAELHPEKPKHQQRGA
jgi:hypothetical protein